MKYTGITYRPPFEASSLLLQVTSGCSHNMCAFCTMYRDVPFGMESMEQIEKDLNEAKQYYSNVRRVFLENGDPFVLPADKLKEIALLIHDRLPEVRTIAMYASVNNIKTKTDAELAQLRRLGINELNIGVESGLDSALKLMNKGYTADEALRELLRLKDAGISYGANVIFGCAGAGHSYENAAATAEMLNKTKPYLIFTGTIHADEGCSLYDDLQSGEFVENTIGEYLDEEQIFLERLELNNCLYFGLHPSNIIQMRGMLSQDKSNMLAHTKEIRQKLGKERLNARPIRYGEDAVLF